MEHHESNSRHLWQPSPDAVLSALYHPAISEEHPAFDRLPAKAKELVAALYLQYDRWSHKLYFKSGLSGRLIAALNGYDWANKLAGCMMIPNQHAEHFPFGRCNLDWFCEFCAYLKGQDLLKKYAGAWAPGAWHELVLSLRTPLCLADPDHDNMDDVWDGMEAILNRLKEEKHMQGYVGWLEIKVHTFWPGAMCTPHIHTLLHCDQGPDAAVFTKIAGEVWNDWRPLPEPALFKPNGWYLRLLRSTRLASTLDLFLQPVKSEAHFYELLQYIKPIALLPPYQRGYSVAKAMGRVEEFHQEVREFFHGLLMESTTVQDRWDKKSKRLRPMLVTRRRFLYGGNCHGSSRHPLGLKEAVRRTQAHQQAVRVKVDMAKEAEERFREAEESHPTE